MNLNFSFDNNNGLENDETKNGDGDSPPQVGGCSTGSRIGQYGKGSSINTREEAEEEEKITPSFFFPWEEVNKSVLCMSCNLAL